MISTVHHALFVHIPKCAGQSIEHFFLRAQNLDWSSRGELCLRPNDDPERGPPRLAHMTAEEYVRLSYLDAERFSRYFKFSFVRNPWARLVSEYRYRPYYVQVFDFKTFVFKKMPAPGWSDQYRHVMPQIDYLTDREGRMLVNFVGKYENLQSDFSKVCQSLGFDDCTLPRVNTTRIEKAAPWSWATRYRIQGILHGRWKISDSPDYKSYYDDETREYVAELYSRDIKAFDYEF